METESDIKRKNLDSGYAEISEKIKNIDKNEKEIKVCNTKNEILKKKHLVKDNNTSQNHNSLVEYLTKLLDNFSENDILECLEKRKKLKFNLNVATDNKLSSTLNKSMNNEKVIFRNSFIKKTSIEIENFPKKLKKGKDNRKTVFQPESSLMNISNPKLKKKSIKVLHNSSDKGIKKTSIKKLKLSSPKLSVAIPEQSFSSLLETPSSSTSSLLKSATTNIHLESDQSQSKTSCNNTKSKEFKDTEKQWQLQRKVNDLSIQVTQLEKKVSVLKNENENLKRQSEDQKGTDEKLKNLKKRNAELSHTVKKLEEAAKKNYGTKTRESKATIENKRYSIKQDLKKHELIDEQHLLEKHQQLINHINSLNAQLYTKQEGPLQDMDHVARVANKERMVLERENDKLSSDLSSKAALCENLEKQLHSLQQELSAIKQDDKEKERRDVDVMNGAIRIEYLEASVQQYKEKVATLNEELLKRKEENQCILETNTQLTEQLDHVLGAEETIQRMECEMETQRKEYMELTATLATLNSSLDASKKQNHSQQKLLAEMEGKNSSLQEEVQKAHNKLQLLSQNHKLEVENFEKMNSDFKVKLEEAEKRERDLRKILEERSNCVTESENVENNQVIDATDGFVKTNKDDNEEQSIKRSPVQHETSNKIETTYKTTVKEHETDKNEQEEQESHVFQALYDYDPTEYSPNTEPSEELLLNEGDYVLVHGSMDEDGFYYGENMDGVKGFIPSNFVRKLSDEEQEEFYQVLSMTTPINNDIVPDLLADDLSSNTLKEDLNKNTSNAEGNIEPPIGLNVEVDDENNSLLITWLPITLSNVASSTGAQVLGYCVYLDGVEVNVVQGAAEDHLMLTGLDEEFLSSAHIITLTTLSINHTESKHCSPFFLNHLPLFMGANHDKNNQNNSIDIRRSNIDQNGEHASTEGHNTPSSHIISEIDKFTTSKYEDNAAITYRNNHKQHKFEGHDASDKDLETKHLSIEEVTLDELQQRGWKHFPGKRKSQQNIKQNDQHLKCQQQSIQHLQQQFLQRSVSVNDVDASNQHKTSIHSEFLPTSQQTLPVQSSFVDSVDFNHSIHHRNFSASNDNSSTSLDSLACCNDHDEKDGGSGDEIDDHCYYENNNLNDKNTFLDKNNNKFLSKKSVTGALNFSNKNSRIDNDQQNNLNYKSIVLTNNTALTPLNIQDRMSDSELIDYEDEEGDSLFDNHHQVDTDGMEKEEEEHLIDEEPVRLFIALFSYDPSTMSPNPDADEVELTFKEGQIIKIYGKKDEDGFFVGEAGGIRGLVPCNMVCEVQVGSDEMSKQLMMESSRALSASILSAVSSSIHPAINLMDTSTNELMEHASKENHFDKNELLESSEVMMMVALYDYNPIENSPNEDIEHELPFKKGDVMEVVGDMDADGFYYAQIKGKFGMVPSNFIAPYHCHQNDLSQNHCSPRSSPLDQYPTSIEQSLYSKKPSTDHPKGFYAATDV